MLKEQNDTISSLPRDNTPEERLQLGMGPIRNPYEQTTVINAYTGEESSCEQREVEENIQSGDWLMPEDEVVIYDKKTFEPRTVKAGDLQKELESGNYSVATDGTNIIDARTGKTVSVSTAEASKLVPKEEWYAPFDRVAVYDKKTGTLSECYAYELEEKLKEGSWALPHEKVVVYDAATGEVSECQVSELQKNLESKKWLLEDQTIKLYNPRTGRSAYYRAQDIKDNMSKYGLVTGNAQVAVYSARDGKMYNVSVAELASLRSGMTTNCKWYTADEEVTLYDRHGRTYTVKAKDMEKVMREKKLYAAPAMGPFKDENLNSAWKGMQSNAETAFEMIGKTQYKMVEVEGGLYYEALPPNVTIADLGDSTPLVVDLMQHVSDGELSYSEMFELMKFLGTTAKEYAEYKTDNLHFIKDGDYLIVKGAHTESALKKGIKGTRYKISDLSPHTNVMQYVKVKPALKEAFFSNAGKASLAVDIALGTGFDIYEEYQNGKRGRDLAMEVVEEFGSNAAISVVSTAASVALVAAIGTAVAPGVGTVIGIITAMFVSDVANFFYERYLEDDAIDLVSAIFDLFGI